MRALTGVGYKLASALGALGVATVAELRRLSQGQLAAALGEAAGARRWRVPLRARAPWRARRVRNPLGTGRGTRTPTRARVRRPNRLWPRARP